MKTSRNALMGEMYKSGKTLEQVGAAFGVTRQRVSQALKKAGVSARSTRLTPEACHRKALRARQKCWDRWGCWPDTLDEMGADGRRAYTYQKRNAEYRGIAWEFTRETWMQVWRDSGKWADRGRCAGQYVMSRFGDVGPYSPANVKIIEGADNIREARGHSRKALSEEEGRGVHCLYPGYSKPWGAFANGRSLGLFETKDEAMAARASAIEEVMV